SIPAPAVITSTAVEAATVTAIITAAAAINSWTTVAASASIEPAAASKGAATATKAAAASMEAAPAAMKSTAAATATRFRIRQCPSKRYKHCRANCCDFFGFHNHARPPRVRNTRVVTAEHILRQLSDGTRFHLRLFLSERIMLSNRAR